MILQVFQRVASVSVDFTDVSGVCIFLLNCLIIAVP